GSASLAKALTATTPRLYVQRPWQPRSAAPGRRCPTAPLNVLTMPDLSEPLLTDFGPLKAESCTRALASDAPPPSRRSLAALRIADQAARNATTGKCPLPS